MLLITTVQFCLERHEEKEVGRKERSKRLEDCNKRWQTQTKGRGRGGKEAGREGGNKVTERKERRRSQS